MNINVTTNGGSSQVVVGGSNVTQIQTTNPFDAELREYVKFLHDNATLDIENSTVWEMAEQFFGHDLEDDELDHVFELLRTAQVEVTVTW